MSSGASLSLSILSALFLLVAGPILATATNLNTDDIVTLIECYETFFPMTGDPFDYTKGMTSEKWILSHQKGQWIEQCLNGRQASKSLTEFYSVSDLPKHISILIRYLIVIKIYRIY